MSNEETIGSVDYLFSITCKLKDTLLILSYAKSCMSPEEYNDYEMVVKRFLNQLEDLLEQQKADFLERKAPPFDPEIERLTNY